MRSQISWIISSEFQNSSIVDAVTHRLKTLILEWPERPATFETIDQGDEDKTLKLYRNLRTKKKHKNTVFSDFLRKGVGVSPNPKFPYQKKT